MKIAITGSIGSGKSFVCQILHNHGIIVYDCDAAAKRLMRTSAEIQHRLSSLVGKDIFVGGRFQKALLADFLLKSQQNAKAVDDIVHPAVAIDFEKSGLDWIESAILFDSGFINRIYLDKIICVSAPEEVRLQRVMLRDRISREKALDWINRQLPQEEVLRRSDYEIVNDGTTDLDNQVSRILNELDKSSKNK
ncbi:dephospho-CoA kinase [Prevotella corporis]|uniref:dephospho-CoA kinase n=1 Tax=Prevotella corporis TaxID=28128 RepID=UPI0023655516|nr:dephospho-CoA kinase [Prevotella corporis]